MRALATFGMNDLRSIQRDSLMLYIVLVPLVIIPLVRLLIPGLTAWLLDSASFHLVPYYPLILSIFIVIQFPVLFGLVFGLLILDERDDNTLMALQVTPVSMDGYLLYRIGMACAFSVLYVLLLAPLSGLMDIALLPMLVPVALVASLLAPLVLMVLVVFASNKLEGLALMKGLGILFLGPIAAFFIESNLQLLLGILPTYWVAKAFWMVSAGENGAGWYMLVGTAYYVLLLAWMGQRFRGRLAST
jgi:fluoroquinolone transport system permease protein